MPCRGAHYRYPEAEVTTPEERAERLGRKYPPDPMDLLSSDDGFAVYARRCAFPGEPVIQTAIKLKISRQRVYRAFKVIQRLGLPIHRSEHAKV